MKQQILGRETVQEVELVEGRGHPGQKSWILRFSGIDTVDQVSFTIVSFFKCYLCLNLSFRLLSQCICFFFFLLSMYKNYLEDLFKCCLCLFHGCLLMKFCRLFGKEKEYKFEHSSQNMLDGWVFFVVFPLCISSSTNLFALRNDKSMTGNCEKRKRKKKKLLQLLVNSQNYWILFNH